MKKYILREYVNGELVNTYQSNYLGTILKHRIKPVDELGGIVQAYYFHRLHSFINGKGFSPYFRNKYRDNYIPYNEETEEEYLEDYLNNN